MSYYFDPDLASQGPCPEILTAQTADGWKAWIPNTKLEAIEKSKGMAISTVRQLYNDKVDCDSYLEKYAKQKRGKGKS